MRSLASMSALVLWMLGCNAAEPVASGPTPSSAAPAPAAPTPGPSQAVTPAPVAEPEVVAELVPVSAPTVDPLAKSGPKPTDFEICTHVMEVTKREYGDSARKPSDEEVAKYREECLGQIGKEREKLGAEKFDAQVACVMAGTKMEDLMICGSPQ
jgi:hypothetical protein